MKKLFLLLAGLLCFFYVSYAQAASDNNNDKDDIVYTGNPFILKDWVDGIVRYAGGRTLTQTQLKYDCARNLLMLQYKGTTFSAEGKVFEFVLLVKRGKNTDSMVFRKGYPVIDDQNNETFYQILTAGKATLLKLFQKKIKEEKQLVGGKLYRRLEDFEYYYLLNDSNMVLLPDDKNKIAEKFGEKSSAIAQFISTQQLKMRTDQDFIAVVKKYNEL